jgi:hypothetical protein
LEVELKNKIKVIINPIIASMDEMAWGGSLKSNALAGK